MADNNEKQKIRFRKRLLSVIGNDRDLLAMGDAKLYTTHKNSNKWLYSDLKGSICFVFDYKAGTRYLYLFDNTSLERLFMMELYKNFDKYYNALTDLFHCFEVGGGGYIGIKFEDEQLAKSFLVTIKKFNDMLTQTLIESSINKKKDSDKRGVFAKNCKMIKSKYLKIFDKLGKYDDNYVEDGMEVHLPKSMNILYYIAYDVNGKKFHLEKNLPKFIKNFFKNVGFNKKKDLKDSSLMLYFIKKIIEEDGKYNVLKIKQGDDDENQDEKILQAETLIYNIIKTNTGNNKYIPKERIQGSDQVVKKEKKRNSDMDLVEIDPKLLENLPKKNENDDKYRQTFMISESGKQRVPTLKDKTQPLPKTNIPVIPSVPIVQNKPSGIPNIPTPPIGGIPKPPPNLVRIFLILSQNLLCLL